YLYRAIDSEGNTIDFYLSRKRDAKAAKCFLKKALASCHATKPHSITADGDKAYPAAIHELKEEKCIPHGIPLRVKKYLNNIIEQDHRFIKKRIQNMLGLKSLQTATKMIAGIEAMHMVKKGQTLQGEKSVQRQIYLINKLFDLTA
ncbi:IS6 family transposase, partial [Bacillus thuringiensis]|nr:IS6 family transposase [Bacillus thuringiensis]